MGTGNIGTGNTSTLATFRWYRKSVAKGLADAKASQAGMRSRRSAAIPPGGNLWYNPSARKLKGIVSHEKNIGDGSGSGGCGRPAGRIYGFPGRRMASGLLSAAGRRRGARGAAEGAVQDGEGDGARQLRARPRECGHPAADGGGPQRAEAASVRGLPVALHEVL